MFLLALLLWKLLMLLILSPRCRPVTCDFSPVLCLFSVRVAGSNVSVEWLKIKQIVIGFEFGKLLPTWIVLCWKWMLICMLIILLHWFGDDSFGSTWRRTHKSLIFCLGSEHLVPIFDFFDLSRIHFSALVSRFHTSWANVLMLRTLLHERYFR